MCTLSRASQHASTLETRRVGETGMYVFTDTDRRVGGPRIYPGLLSPGCWVLLGAGLLNSDTPLDLRHHRLYSERPKRSAETCTSGRTCGKHMGNRPDYRLGQRGAEQALPARRCFLGRHPGPAGLGPSAGLSGRAGRPSSGLLCTRWASTSMRRGSTGVR